MVSIHREKLVDQITAIVQAGGIVMAEDGSVGPYRTATGRGGKFALIYKASVRQRNSARHAVYGFVNLMGHEEAAAALRRYQDQ